MVAGNAAPLAAGHAFSVEPGIYFPGRFGMRLEDIVVATDAGPRRLNEAPPRPRRRRVSRPMKLDGGDVPAAVGHRRARRSAGSRPAAARSASATAGCCAACTGCWRSGRPRCSRPRRRTRNNGGDGARSGRRSAVAAATALALAVSVVRRGAVCAARPPSGNGAKRTSRPWSRPGPPRRRTDVDDPVGSTHDARHAAASSRRSLDLLAPVAGLVGLLAAAVFAGGPYPLAAARLLVGAALPRRGERRDAARPLVPRAARTAPRPAHGAGRLDAVVWPFEVALCSVADRDGAGLHRRDRRRVRGLLGWMWVVSAFTTIVLVGVTWLALRSAPTRP